MGKKLFKKKDETNLLLVGLVAVLGVGGFMVYRKQQEHQDASTPTVDTSGAPATQDPFGVSYGTRQTVQLIGNPTTGSLFTVGGYYAKPLLPASGGNNAISTSSDLVGSGYGVSLGSAAGVGVFSAGSRYYPLPVDPTIVRQ